MWEEVVDTPRVHVSAQKRIKDRALFAKTLIHRFCQRSVFYLPYFILHSRESELYRYTLDGMFVLAWELPFSRFMGHLSST